MSSPLIAITGAAGGLGKALAEHFTNLGARLLLIDVNEQALEAAFGRGDEHRVLLAVNLASAHECEAALGPVIERLGPVEVLCNVAGGFDMGPAVHETADDAWRQLVDLNVATVINACRTMIPGMVYAGKGHVINISAASATKGSAAQGAYIASKSAVARLTESMAMELRHQGVNVNAVAPSIIDTPANRASMPDVDPAAWVRPRDLARIIAFLASDDACAIHGAVIPVVGLS